VKEDRISPWYVFASACTRHGPKRALWSRASGEWTFTQLYAQTVRYAQWMIERGVRPGDLVAISMTNRPEFFMLVFATHCLGASASLINYNLEGKALLHCLDVCQSKLLIVEDEVKCRERMEGSRGEIEGRGTKIVVLDGEVMEDVSRRTAEAVPGDEWRKGVKGSFPFVLIYTSGTTGMPKGCVFSTSRMHLLG
jgi:acyl-coenzyme A synthetase/AMP-(fatty) acid ligase